MLQRRADIAGRYAGRLTEGGVMFTPERFDEDFRGRFDFDDETPALRLVDAPTRCIEHGLFSCAECDGAWIQPMAEQERIAA